MRYVVYSIDLNKFVAMHERTGLDAPTSSQIVAGDDGGVVVVFSSLLLFMPLTHNSYYNLYSIHVTHCVLPLWLSSLYI